MNCYLYYFKNAKFNLPVKKILSIDNKKYYQHINVRHLSQNNRQFNQSKPPNDNFWLIVSILIGTYVIIKKK